VNFTLAYLQFSQITTYNVLWILIFDTLLYCTAENRLVNNREWNQQSGFALWKLTPISCPVQAVQIVVGLKSLEDCDYNATRFSWPHRPAVHDFLCWLLFFGLQQIKSHLGDSNNTYKKHLKGTLQSRPRSVCKWGRCCHALC